MDTSLKQNKPLGTVQIGLKILEKNETKLNKVLYFFNMIDTTTRFAYSRLLENADTPNIIAALNEGYNFFEKSGINITNIQNNINSTFKKIDSIKLIEIEKWCSEHNIITNSLSNKIEDSCCIKRFSRTISEEFNGNLRNYNTFEQIENELLRFLSYYDYQRYLHYKELDKVDSKNKYMKPIEAIEYFKSK